MRLTRPLLTCEAAIAEALFLLRRGGIDPDGLLNLIIRGLVVPEFPLVKEIWLATRVPARSSNSGPAIKTWLRTCAGPVIRWA